MLSSAHSSSTKAITAGLIVTLALQSAVPPFATDMYSPAFPQVASGLNTSAALVGMTLASFFGGMGLGQVIGGAISDQTGRRRPILIGGVLCTLGALGCVLSGSIGLLIVARFVQGLGGGAAAAVARAVLVDIAEGDRLAKTMSLLMAIGGFAPMVAPILGGVIASVASWRVVFWCLVGFGLAMTISAWAVIPESLPPRRRHRGGLRQLITGAKTVLHIRTYVGYLVLNCFSNGAMFAYISDSSYVLQEIAGLTPLVFSLVFAGNAMLQMLLTFLNSWLVGRFRLRTLIRFGLAVSAIGVGLLSLSVFAFGTPLIMTCAGFAVLLGAQAFIFGNTSALALGHARHVAGIASALLGLISSLTNAIVAPLASAGGATSAVPMVVVMLVGTTGAWAVFVLLRHDG